jgi:hypothetical protein
MNRKGYTEFGSNLSNAEGFHQRINDGAKYLILNDSTLLSREYLAPFVQKEIGRHENILIFDLK